MQALNGQQGDSKEKEKEETEEKEEQEVKEEEEEEEDEETDDSSDPDIEEEIQASQELVGPGMKGINLKSQTSKTIAYIQCFQFMVRKLISPLLTCFR